MIGNLALDLLCEAAGQNDPDEVNRILAETDVQDAIIADKHEKLKEAFFDAVSDEHVPVVKCLLNIESLLTELKSEVEALSEPLQWSAEDGNLELVNLLLQIEECAQNAATSNNEALYNAVEQNRANIVERLLQIPSVREGFVHITYLLSDRKIQLDTLKTIQNSYNSNEFALNFTVSGNPELDNFKQKLSKAIANLELSNSLAVTPTYLPSAANVDMQSGSNSTNMLDIAECDGEELSPSAKRLRLN